MANSYEHSLSPNKAMPPYLETALTMADEILKAEPINQNDMLREIFMRVKQERIARIENATKELDYLKESYQTLIGMIGEKEPSRS